MNWTRGHWQHKTSAPSPPPHPRKLQSHWGLISGPYYFIPSLSIKSKGPERTNVYLFTQKSRVRWWPQRKRIQKKRGVLWMFLTSHRNLGLNHTKCIWESLGAKSKGQKATPDASLVQATKIFIALWSKMENWLRMSFSNKQVLESFKNWKRFFFFFSN